MLFGFATIAISVCALAVSIAGYRLQTTSEYREQLRVEQEQLRAEVDKRAAQKSAAAAVTWYLDKDSVVVLNRSSDSIIVPALAADVTVTPPQFFGLGAVIPSCWSASRSGVRMLPTELWFLNSEGRWAVGIDGSVSELLPAEFEMLGASLGENIGADENLTLTSIQSC